MTDRFKFLALHRAGRFAVVRVMESGEVAGYDPVADRNDEQRHFQIHRGPAAYDAAFGDSRKYEMIDVAIADAEKVGREVEIDETVWAIARADVMIDRLEDAARVALAGERLTRQDRFGYESDMRLRPLHDRLVGLGWIVETSTHGSIYYTRGGERLRLSNHEVPWTAERGHAAEHGRWSWDRCGWQIITERQTVEQCLAEIEEMEEAIADSAA